MLNRSRIYRIGALTLALVFFVFNVGLPVVLSSCPMAKAPQCPLCAPCCTVPAPGTVNLTNPVDHSCCATVILADRNKTEFVQEKCNHDAQDGRMVVSPLQVLQAVWGNHTRAFNTVVALHSSPPRVNDIPIFISSLLI